MKGPGRTARRAPRAVARITALVVVLAAGGLLAGTASASGTQATAAQGTIASLIYRCLFPSGPNSVQVAVGGSVPAAAKTGKPIQPGGVSLTMTLPPAAVSGLASLDTATVSAATRLTVSASEGPSGTSTLWPGTTRRPVPRPTHGGLTLTTSGTVPPVTASSAREVILTAAGLSVMFTGGKAAVPAPGPASSPTSAASGTAAVPSTAAMGRPPLLVNCALAPGQHATLGSVLVTGRAPRAALHSAGAPLCPPLPPGGLKLNPRFPPPKPPPGSTVGSAPAQGCAFTAGYADARKLNGAAFIQPGLTNVDLFVRTVTNFDPKVNYAEFDNAAVLDFHGKRQFPPSTATFLTFGFVPTTATIELMEHGTVNIFAVGPALPSNCKPHQPCDTIATVASRLSVRIVPGSVKVNGVPLDVGSHCETPPFDAILTGTSASHPPYNVVSGGPLSGMVTIPKFSNCGVGENLDPIFNSAISGPMNFNLLTQGPVCFLLGGGVCGKHGPVKPNPILHEVSG
jgi:Family of unknown function (DUF6801)